VATDDALPAAEVTQLLAALAGGDRAALDRLFSLVYDELKRLASAQLAMGGAKEATLSTTVLVHEAYVRFVRSAELAVNDRNHFYSLAARAMRQILVDHARRRLAQRRGGQAQVLPLEDWDQPVEVDLERVMGIDAALERLAALDQRLAQIVEWRVFAGLTLEEIATVSELSTATLKRDWRKARAFLHRELSTGQVAPPPG
jgi:RNA polymerase sigma factor (TIGR02999 family)